MLYYKATCEKHDYFTGETVAKDELCTAKERYTRYRYVFLPCGRAKVTDI